MPASWRRFGVMSCAMPVTMMARAVIKRSSRVLLSCSRVARGRFTRRPARMNKNSWLYIEFAFLLALALLWLAQGLASLWHALAALF